ncbi:MAG: PAS domain-containing protein [Hyphomicrobium sp.]|nr:PAS domain-containing protein [Hyphomicrobium sp.]
MAMNARQPVNILLVDDQPAKLLSYEVILAELGENLIKANSASEALSALLKTDVAVVLVDVCMPDLDGFQLAEMIRGHPRYEKTAIIFISAIQVTDLDRIRGYKTGAVDYVPVPVIPEILRAKVRIFTELYRKNRQLEELAADLERRVAERTAELERSTARLRESEERLRLALSAARMGTWRRDLTTELSQRDANFNAIMGLPSIDSTASMDERLGEIHPDDRDAVAAAWSRAVEAQGDYEAEFRIKRRDGAIRWVRDQGRFVPGGNGQPHCLAGLTLDITERKRAEEAQALLIQELNHRVKNMLTTVQAIALQSLNGAQGADKDRFLSRIQALATCHNLLTRSSWEGAKLRDILDSTFAPHRSLQATQRIELSGQDTLLSSRDALSVTLALHELVTNAVKYGAFANNQGRIQLSWHVEPSRSTTKLRLAWREEGGPPVKAPRHKGFGSRLLTSLAAQSGAAYSCEYPSTGFKCELALPLERRA